MKTLHVIALVVAASALVPAFALSGEHRTPEVSISPTPYVAGRTRAQGSVMGARNSADSVQYIECRAHQELAYCFARDASGRSFMCSSTSPAILTAVTAVNETSFIVVDATLNDGVCRNLEITNGSHGVVPISTAPVVTAPTLPTSPVQP